MMKTALLIISLLTVSASQGHSETTPARHSLTTPAYAAIYDLEFPGGSLSDLLKTLSSQDKVPLNIVLTEGAGDLKIPKLTLVGVQTRQVLSALALMGPAVGRWERVEADSNFWVVSTWESIHRADQHSAPHKVHPVYIGKLLKKYSIDDLAAAITFALPKREGSSPSVSLRLHKETSLLIIEASDPDIDIAIEVISELNKAMSV